MNKDAISIRSGIEELGIFEKGGDAWVSSRDIAKLFEKAHYDVLDAIREKIIPNISEEFTARNFPVSKYRDTTGRKLPEYLLNRKSFSMVVMGFTGKKAMAFKEAYIEAFEAMIDVINTRLLSKAGYKEMTSAISRKLKNDPRVFSIEADMINSIVLGMKAADFRAVHKIDDHGGTRDAVAYRKLDDLDRAQRLNAQLINAGISFEARKQIISSNFRRG